MSVEDKILGGLFAIAAWNRRPSDGWRTARAEAIEEAAGVADHMAVEEDVLAEHYRLLNASRLGEQQENAMTRSAACRHVAGAIRALAERKKID